MEFNSRTQTTDFDMRDYQDIPQQLRDVVKLIEGFNVTFLYDDAYKLIERMRAREMTKLYPLIALTGWSETEETNTHLSVTLDQLIIASATKADYFSEQRDKYHFKPILVPIQNEFERRLINSGYYLFSDNCTGIEYASRRREMFFGDDSQHDGASPIDAVVYEGISLTINKSLTLKKI